ncbi:substrate-binding domain-containing protein [Streptomyces sp. NBC_01538]|uniref:substrate-binding domain-containing protein n=1 Tax=Streptomyces sp. NBC_01538 TaxID=2903897 RepID=UPI00386329F0
MDQTPAQGEAGDNPLTCAVARRSGTAQVLHRAPRTWAHASCPTAFITWSPGGLAATRHLIELGHRRIAIINGPERRLTSRARVDGYRSALAEAGLPFDPELVRYGDFTHGLAHQHALDILSLPERPTAIFAGSDHQALGTCRAAAELGLRVPADVSVVGFDDLPFADWVTPRLTTVRTPLADMTALSARMVLRLLSGEQPETTRVEVVTRLVVRESSGPPPVPPAGSLI